MLITGGAGFLGSHLADALLARGNEVYVLDIAPEHKICHQLGHPRFHYIRNSVLNAEILEALLAPCDLIYHLAAVVGVEHYLGDPYQVLHVNINGTQAVLTQAWKHGKKVVFSSTSEVYGRSRQLPFEENGERLLGSTRIDRWCYATAKQAAEHFCFAFHKRGLPVVVLRYFNVDGPRMDQLDRGRVYCSITRLAREMNVDASSVKKLMKKLRGDKCIEPTGETSPEGIPVYRLVGVAISIPERSSKIATRGVVKRCRFCREGVANLPPSRQVVDRQNRDNGVVAITHKAEAKKCGRHGCHQPQCPHWQQCAEHASC